MTLEQKINQDFLAAMKAKDQEKVLVLRGVKTAISNWKADKKNIGKEMTDSDVIGILSSEAKKRNDAIDIYTQDGSDKGKLKAIKENVELNLINAYLPKQFTEEELREMVCAFITESSVLPELDPKVARGLLGGIMRKFSAEYKGQYDPKTLKIVAEKILGLVQ